MESFSVSVDQVLYINLDHRTDRMEHMRSILSESPWPVKRIPGIQFRSAEEAGGDVGKSVAVLGIWRSHLNALRRGLDLIRNESLVLLQDDVRIDSGFLRNGLVLPTTPPDNWEIILLSPRYRARIPIIDSQPDSRKWIRKPFGNKPVRLREAYRKYNYICNGAHFCIFRNMKVIENVVRTMDDTEFKTNFDLFCVLQFKTFGIHVDEVGTAGFGSDHVKPVSGRPDV